MTIKSKPKNKSTNKPTQSPNVVITIIMMIAMTWMSFNNKVHALGTLFMYLTLVFHRNKKTNHNNSNKGGNNNKNIQNYNNYYKRSTELWEFRGAISELRRLQNGKQFDETPARTKSEE